jgi:membrane protein implicated in regulation of membrane protease activity
MGFFIWVLIIALTMGALFNIPADVLFELTVISVLVLFAIAKWVTSPRQTQSKTNNQTNQDL